MKVLVTIAAILVAAHADSLENQWHEFKVTHGKSYNSFMEEMSRFIIFQDNVREIENHNEKFARREVSYSKGIDQFADMTQEEFDATLAPLSPLPLSLFPEIEFNVSEVVEADELGAPEEFNWVRKGIVAPVRNQGACESCWAFVVAGTIGSQVMKKKGGLVILSPQNLVDCDRNNHGCKPGYPEYAYIYAQQNGILTEKEYPYVGKQEACHKKGGQKISGFVRIPKDEKVLLIMLYVKGPIAIAIDGKGLNGYNGGVIDTYSQCTDIVNHGVILVGAGIENGKKYWLVQNSWGDKWGDKGYFKIERGVGACGLGSMCTYPVL